jgi:hypothetical protein
MLWVSAAARRHVARWFGARDTLQAAARRAIWPAGTCLNNTSVAVTCYWKTFSFSLRICCFSFPILAPPPTTTHQEALTHQIWILHYYCLLLTNQHLVYCGTVQSKAAYTFGLLVKLKVKVSLCFNWAPRQEGVLGEWRYSSTHSLISSLDVGEWSATRPGCFIPRNRARNSSVGIALGYGLYDRGSRVRFPAGRTALGPTEPPVRQLRLLDSG